MLFAPLNYFYFVLNKIGQLKLFVVNYSPCLLPLALSDTVVLR